VIHTFSPWKSVDPIVVPRRDAHVRVRRGLGSVTVYFEAGGDEAGFTAMPPNGLSSALSTLGWTTN